MSRRRKRRKDKRKSPYKHDVREHIRNGRTVLTYERGKGDQKKKKKRRERKQVEDVVKKREPRKSGEYDVRVEYPDKSYENVMVQASNYHSAIKVSHDTRTKLRAPMMLRLRRT